MRDDGTGSAAEELLAPRLLVSPTSRVQELEKFSHYVGTVPESAPASFSVADGTIGFEGFAGARQIGFDDANECPHLCTLAYDYLRKNKGYEENIFAFFQNNVDPEPLIVKFIEELDKCILGYFSFHWNYATYIITQVLTVEGATKRKFKNFVLEATRAFWSGASANSVVVEADAFKETDVIYRAISSRGHHNDMLRTAELVHQSSLDAASSVLVTALNEGRDVILDGTLSWEPFVQQTIAMARDVHRQRYRMGRGYKVSDDGTITEEYWEPVDGSITDEENEVAARKPYRIELVGVVCDAYLAVVRGIRRAVITGRAVRVKSQLQSHKRFATAFKSYCSLVDNARLYSTNTLGAAKLIGWKDGGSNLLVDPEEIVCLDRVGSLNEEADCVHELYADGQPTGDSSSVWEDLVMSPSRASAQRELKAAIEKGEARFRPALALP
ncbi:hypothetical protein HU200_024021 [Digitaria exilis]|uniref:Zeta toxin domain-containing protein n=1 Tax=Digitaria exilis TaxID=1010633 RepID=A0A835C1H4_9POAL|nr:hypothetical protein HU200_024021 [Digitaria exilis]